MAFRRPAIDMAQVGQSPVQGYVSTTQNNTVESTHMIQGQGGDVDGTFDVSRRQFVARCVAKEIRLRVEYRLWQTCDVL